MVVYKSIKPSDLPRILRRGLRNHRSHHVSDRSIRSHVVRSVLYRPAGCHRQCAADVSDNKYVILLLINLLLLVAGMFMDITPAVLIFAPIFLPVVKSFGMDPIHFGIMMVMNSSASATSPRRSVRRCSSGCQVANMDMEDMVKPLLPFYAAIFIAPAGSGMFRGSPWSSLNLVMGS